MTHYEALQKWWDYPSFRGIQEEVIACVWNGVDCFAKAQTGAGKTLYFQVPTMARDWLCVIVTPTLSLIKDQVDDLTARGISAVEISSQVTPKWKRFAIEEIRADRVNFVYLSPEMLFNEEIIALFNDVYVDLLVVDEAHCAKMWNKFRSGYRKLMSHQLSPFGIRLSLIMKDNKEASNLFDGLGIYRAFTITDSLNHEHKFKSGGYLKLKSSMPFPVPINKETSYFICDGLEFSEDFTITDSLNHEHKFKSGYLRLMNGIPFPVGVKLAMTATANKEMSHFVCDGLGIDKDFIITDSLNREQMSIAFVEKTAKTDPIKKIAELAGRNQGSILVYAATTKQVREAAESLIAIGVDCACYYGTGLTKAKKIENQEAFLSGEIKAMVCTGSFGMGIDKSDVRYVVHLGLPNSIENAWQEAGRGSRDGQPFTWAMYYHQRDLGLWNYIQSEDKEQHQDDKDNLAAMYALATSTDCIKKQVMHYFGEAIDNCGKCHNCKRGLK